MVSRKRIIIDARIRETSTGRYTDRLIEHLQSIDTSYDYIILLNPNDRWQPSSPAFKTLPCPFPQFSLNPLDQISFAWFLYKLKPALVHFTMTQQPLPYFGKIVTTTHDLTMFKFVRKGKTPLFLFRMKMLLYRLLFNWSHLKSSKIIVPTQYVANDLATYQPSVKKKIVTTYEASEKPLDVAPQKPTQVNANDKFIMYVGSAFPHKNLETLAKAFELLYHHDPELKLILVGKNEIHYQELEKKIQSYQSIKNILVSGFLPDEQVSWLYKHCLAYVFPSLSEGFGLPGLEAMAHGAPVVSSNASCLPEVYGDAAYYFDPNDPEDIAKKISEVLRNKELQETLIKSGYMQLKKYSWHHMAEQTLSVYEEVLGEATTK